MVDAQGSMDADRYLIEQVRSGNEEAWQQLIERYQGRLYAFARSKLGPTHEAEDVVQEAFIGFVQSLPTFDASRSLETYLFSILRYQLYRVYRKRPKDKGLGFDPLADDDVEFDIAGPNETPSGLLRRQELAREQEAALADALRKMIRELRDRDRLEDLEVVELSFFAGMRNRDIAASLGRVETHVGSIKYRAVQRVKELINAQSRSASRPEIASEVTVSKVWRAHRLSCLKRSTLGSYQLGVLDEPWQSFCRFHLETVRCPLCLANAEDLAAETADIEDTGLRQQIFASSIGFLSRSGR